MKEQADLNVKALLEISKREWEEKQAVYESKLSDFERQSELWRNQSQNLNLEHAFMKWMVSVKLRRILEGIKHFEERPQVLCQVRLLLRKIFVNQQDIFNHHFQFIRKSITKTQLVSELKQQLNEIMEKNRMLNVTNAYLKLECQEMEVSNYFYKHVIDAQQMIVEQQGNRINEITTQLSNHRHEYELMSISFNEQKTYIRALEKELERLNQLFKRMSLQHPQVNFFQQNPVTGLEQLRLKVQNELNNRTIKSIGDVLKDHQREKFTITDIFDLNQEIQVADHEFQNPLYQKVQLIDETQQTGIDVVNMKIQTENNREEACIGTDFTCEDLQNLEEELQQIKNAKSKRSLKTNNSKSSHHGKQSRLYKQNTQGFVSKGSGSQVSQHEEGELLSDQDNKPKRSLTQGHFIRDRGRSFIQGSPPPQKDESITNFNMNKLDEILLNHQQQNKSMKEIQNLTDQQLKFHQYGNDNIRVQDFNCYNSNNQNMIPNEDYTILSAQDILQRRINYLNRLFEMNGANTFAKQSRILQTGATIVQVIPKYELVSSNLRVFEKMLNKKLGLEKRNQQTQTDNSRFVEYERTKHSDQMNESLGTKSDIASISIRAGSAIVRKRSNFNSSQKSVSRIQYNRKMQYENNTDMDQQKFSSMVTVTEGDENIKQNESKLIRQKRKRLQMIHQKNQAQQLSKLSLNDLNKQNNSNLGNDRESSPINQSKYYSSTNQTLHKKKRIQSSLGITNTAAKLANQFSSTQVNLSSAGGINESLQFKTNVSKRNVGLNMLSTSINLKETGNSDIGSSWKVTNTSVNANNEEKRIISKERPQSQHNQHRIYQKKKQEIANLLLTKTNLQSLLRDDE